MLTLRKSLGAVFLVSLVFAGSLGALREVIGKTSAAPVASLNRENLLIQDELYFGMSQPGGGMVSEAQWQKFLNSEITPRFPKGLTVMDAFGQFLERGGNLGREKTKVVILIYHNSPEKQTAIQDIIKIYKSQFQQESVMRVTNVPVKVDFY